MDSTFTRTVVFAYSFSKLDLSFSQCAPSDASHTVLTANKTSYVLWAVRQCKQMLGLGTNLAYGILL